MRFSLAVCLFLLVFVNKTFAENEKDICNKLISDPEVEKYFAENAVSKMALDKEKDREEGTLVGGDSGGTCHYDSEILKIDKNNNHQNIELDCSYTGCSFGGQSEFVRWNNKIYALSESYLYSPLNKIKGWDKLSSEEQKVLSLRNKVYEIYEVNLKSKAKAVCESYMASRDFHMKSLIDNPICKNFIDNDIKRFPSKVSDGIHEIKDEAILSSLTRNTNDYFDIPNYTLKVDLNNLIDIDNDKEYEVIAEAELLTTAGCGCYTSFPVFLNKHADKLSTNSELKKAMREYILDHRDCSNKMKLVKLNDKSFVEIEYGNHAREIVSFDNPEYKPETICSFVNDSRLAFDGIKNAD